jgi:hypothetical protein
MNCFVDGICLRVSVEWWSLSRLGPGAHAAGGRRPGREPAIQVSLFARGTQGTNASDRTTKKAQRALVARRALVVSFADNALHSA